MHEQNTKVLKPAKVGPVELPNGSHLSFLTIVTTIDWTTASEVNQDNRVNLSKKATWSSSLYMAFPETFSKHSDKTSESRTVANDLALNLWDEATYKEYKFAKVVGDSDRCHCYC